MGGKSKSVIRLGMIMLLSFSFILAGCGGSDKTATSGDAKAGNEASGGSGEGKPEPFEITAFIGEATSSRRRTTKFTKRLRTSWA